MNEFRSALRHLVYAIQACPEGDLCGADWAIRDAKSLLARPQPEMGINRELAVGLYTQLTDLVAQRERLTKALQFYADIGNHRGNTRTGYVPIVDAHNLGDIARAALASPPPGGLQFAGEATQDQSGEFKVTLPGSDWS